MIFKTNVKVPIKSRTGQLEFVYMNIFNTQKEDTRYLGKIEYYWIKEKDTGNIDVNNDPIMEYEKVFIESTTSEFTIVQARALQDAYYPNGLPGDYEDEHMDSLIEVVANYQMDLPKEQSGHPYGLGSSGWTKQ